MTEGKHCSVANCGFVTPTTVPEGTGIQYKVPLLKLQMEELKTHRTDAHDIGGGAGRVDCVPVVQDAPKLQQGVDHRMWDKFMTRGEVFKTTMGVDGAPATSWLFHCLDKDLGDKVIEANPGRDP